MKKMTVEAWKKCPVCGKTENQVRAGYNGSGSQRCKCKECGKYYTTNPKQHTYPEETRKLALKMYYGGSGVDCARLVYNITPTGAEVKGHPRPLDPRRRRSAPCPSSRVVNRASDPQNRLPAGHESCSSPVCGRSTFS